LVVYGNHQQPNIDYHETLSPAVKPVIIRLVLSLALTFGWSIRQLDIKNAFLHGILTEEVYTCEPLRFVDSQFPHHVCKLKKAIYGSNRHVAPGSTSSVAFFLRMFSLVPRLIHPYLFITKVLPL